METVERWKSTTLTSVPRYVGKVYQRLTAQSRPWSPTTTKEYWKYGNALIKEGPSGRLYFLFEEN